MVDKEKKKGRKPYTSYCQVLYFRFCPKVTVNNFSNHTIIAVHKSLID